MQANVITISGPPKSGKSALADKMAKLLAYRLGFSVTVLDDGKPGYYVGRLNKQHSGQGITIKTVTEKKEQ